VQMSLHFCDSNNAPQLGQIWSLVGVVAFLCCALVSQKLASCDRVFEGIFLFSIKVSRV